MWRGKEGDKSISAFETTMRQSKKRGFRKRKYKKVKRELR
jgi:hypothetical protein